jgi:hypothetical protein
MMRFKTVHEGGAAARAFLESLVREFPADADSRELHSQHHLERGLRYPPFEVQEPRYGSSPCPRSAGGNHLSRPCPAGK